MPLCQADFLEKKKLFFRSLSLFHLFWGGFSLYILVFLNFAMKKTVGLIIFFLKLLFFRLFYTHTVITNRALVFIMLFLILYTYYYDEAYGNLFFLF